MNELLNEFNKKLIKVVEGNYSDSELSKEVVSLRKEVDKKLNKLEEIEHLCKVSLTKELIDLIEDVDKETKQEG